MNCGKGIKELIPGLVGLILTRMQGGMEYYQAQPARGGGGASAAAQVAQHQIQVDP